MPELVICKKDSGNTANSKEGLCKKMVYFVFSPTLQTSTIKCINGSSTRVHLEQSSKIHVPAWCSIKLTKHKITSGNSAKISPPPLRYRWSWYAFTLPSSLLSNPAHLDQAINELRANI